MVLGWATNCLPAALPARLALVVAAYSAGDNDFIAASGRYRSPVLLDGFPLLVRHFWSPQSLRDFWGALSAIAVTPICLKVLNGVPQNSRAVFKHSKRSVALPAKHPAKLTSFVIMVYCAVDQSYFCLADCAAAFLSLIPIHQLFWCYSTARTSFSKRPRVFFSVLGNPVLIVLSPVFVSFV
jgi:hypothetical protein